MAREKLDQILDSSVKISRNNQAKLAELLRRSGQPQKSISLLFKFVRRKGRNFKPASTAEKEEYAAALLALRATEEGFMLLNELREEKSAKTFLFLGMAHINKWDYEKAATELRAFLNFKNVIQYDRYIGITNLMASLVALSSQSNKEVSALEEEINEYLEDTAKLGFKVLHANLLEIKSQLLVKSLNEKSSKALFSKASAIINDPNSKDNLFIRKWEIIAKKPATSASSKIISDWVLEMENLRLRAQSINHVETIRDIDFHLGDFSPDLIEKSYFGTPYESFRKKIIETYNPVLPASFWYEVSANKKVKTYEFDYLEFSDLKVGSVILKMLKALSHDLYKKQTKYTLFELVFPGDYLNPESSFNKTHQALKRTRDWLKDHKIPLEIVEHNEEYFLEGNVAIKMYLDDREKEQDEKKDEAFFHELNLLKGAFKRDSFKINSAMEILEHSNVRKTQRLLKKALESSLIQKEHSGKNTIYFFTFEA